MNFTFIFFALQDGLETGKRSLENINAQGRFYFKDW